MFNQRRKTVKEPNISTQTRAFGLASKICFWDLWNIWVFNTCSTECTCVPVSRLFFCLGMWKNTFEKRIKWSFLSQQDNGALLPSPRPVSYSSNYPLVTSLAGNPPQRKHPKTLRQAEDCRSKNKQTDKQTKPGYFKKKWNQFDLPCTCLLLDFYLFQHLYKVIIFICEKILAKSKNAPEKKSASTQFSCYHEY